MICLENRSEEDIKDNMSKLELPPLLTEQLKYLVKPIGIEIQNWEEFHEAYLEITFHPSFNISGVRILKQLCWTMLGTVDYPKTAEKLILNEMFDVVKCYKLACLYCLDDYIPVLWEKLPEESKRHFYKKEGPLQVTSPELEFCWPYILKGEDTKLDYMPGRRFGDPTTFNQYAFEYSACRGNKAATEYFFRKLTKDQREASLFKTVQAVVIRRSEYLPYSCFSTEKLSDTFCYLLSLMSPEQQMEIFKLSPFNILKCFLDWPWQDLFLDIVELVWSFLTPFDYVYLLRNISARIPSCYFQIKLFQDIFLRGHSDFRKHFVDEECLKGFSFRAYFTVKDSKIIKVIFRNVDSADKKRLLSSMNLLRIFYLLILGGKLCLVKLFLKEASLSKEDKEIIKEAYSGYLTELYGGETIWKGRECEQFFHLLDEIKIKS
ncbi:hypothetical protein AVEN_271503-1, partial [Araneus ventricosus]